MKKFVCILTLIFIGVFGYGQVQYIDVIYLKNGGKISGIIIEQVPGESIKLETSDGGILIFQMDEIEKMVKERVNPAPPPQAPAVTPSSPSVPQPAASPVQQQTPVSQSQVIEPPTTGSLPAFFQKGMHGSFMGGSVSWKQVDREMEVNGQEQDITPSDATNSRFVFDGLVILQGAGNAAIVFGGTVNSYPNGWMSPYFLGMNYYFSLNKFSPYVYGRAGYGLGELEVSVFGEDKFDARGFYANGGAGLKFYINQSWGINTEIGYAYQKAVVDEKVESDLYHQTIDFREEETLAGIGLAVGFFFYP